MNELVALEIKLEAVRQQLTNSSLAKTLKMSRGYVGNLLNGRAALTLPLVEKFASALGVNPSDLIIKALEAKRASTEGVER